MITQQTVLLVGGTGRTGGTSGLAVASRRTIGTRYAFQFDVLRQLNRLGGATGRRVVTVRTAVVGCRTAGMH